MSTLASRALTQASGPDVADSVPQEIVIAEEVDTSWRNTISSLHRAGKVLPLAPHHQLRGMPLSPTSLAVRRPGVVAVKR